MGYTTDFNGKFDITPTLKPEHAEYLRHFNNTRRMGRNANEALKLKDIVRELAELPIGDEGGYFVGGGGFAGQEKDSSITEYNDPPLGQPGLWCKWTPNSSGSAIEWDGGEKFYYYIEWIEYLIKHFLQPWGYTVDGEVDWVGEDKQDTGSIVITNNKVSSHANKI